MARVKKQRSLENVEVIDLGDKGRAVGRAEDGRIVLVEGAVPGDVVNGIVVQKKKGMWIVKPNDWVTRSVQRVEPFCQHFGTCGGCKWQNFAYPAQLQYKEKAVRDALSRIAHLNDAHVNPIIGCEDTQFYRNKLEFTFTDQRWLTQKEIDEGAEVNRNGLGFHVPGSFARVVDLTECHLQRDPSNDIRKRVREMALTRSIPFQNIRTREGILRNLVVRSNAEGEVMIILVLTSEEVPVLDYLLEDLKEQFPQIVSIYYCINRKLNDSTYDLPMHLYWGEPYLRQNLGDVVFELGPKSFFQTNANQAKRLYDVAVEMASITPEDLVFDLYCGIGSISLYVADKAKFVVGVEEVSEAIEDAKRNSKINNIQNTAFYAGDAKDVLKSAEFARHGKPDVLITDPPRAGMHASVIESIIELSPRRIIYVSCNPSTQARDLALLAQQYQFICATPVDMFPHTSHIENVALLERKEE